MSADTPPAPVVSLALKLITQAGESSSWASGLVVSGALDVMGAGIGCGAGLPNRRAGRSDSRQGWACKLREFQEFLRNVV
ncbi:hypothetical protein CATMQ487_51890 [Sphaerotilus microaerophilus]|uniref:Uncharacterized protein n=1 Tax=Sphaerotilus microaerophilus TaxID=2914710 RepID=A0ABN6PSU3_9BURK|nr:hypothetical protein CATMQ487_51890 [Sphaerotilus sp. FB-5]